jgi:hypothetical protein
MNGRSTPSPTDCRPGRRRTSIVPSGCCDRVWRRIAGMSPQTFTSRWDVWLHFFSNRSGSMRPLKCLSKRSAWAPTFRPSGSTIWTSWHGAGISTGFSRRRRACQPPPASEGCRRTRRGGRCLATHGARAGQATQALLWMSRRRSWSCRASGARRRPAGLRLATSVRSGSELVSRMRLWRYGRRPSTKAATTPRPPTGFPCTWNGGRSMPAPRS